MSVNYRKLGEIVELIDERNKDGKVQNLIGVSIDKCFIKSVANTIGTDLTKYQVIRKNDFACSLMQVSRDGKIPIACLKDYDEAIMSPAYYIFRIKNTNEVLPDYLAMWFMRTEFDREASYIAVGGVRGSMPWEDFCDMKLPVPDIKEQEKIVNTYNAITKRIQIKKKINENLERTAQCLFDELNKDKTSNEKLGNIAEINSGKRPDDISDGLIPFVGAGDVMGYINNYNYDGKTLVIGRVGTHGKVQRFNDKCWCSDNTLTIKSKYFEYTYFILKNIDYSLLNRGSTQPLITQTDMKDFEIYFNRDEILNFENSVSKIMNNYDVNKVEIAKLQELKQLIISRISGM